MYRAFSAVFGKVGRIASPDVVVELVKLSVCQYYVTASRYVLLINLTLDLLGRLKTREWKMRYGQNCKGGNAGVENAGVNSRGGKCRSGKCGSKQQGWKMQE